MEINDYVRTNIPTYNKFVGITKFESENDEYWFFEDLTLAKRLDRRCKKQEDIKKYVSKSSKDILDLLEPMDLLYIDIDGGFEGGIIVPRIPETQNELNEYIKKIKSGEYILKGVVTHEQLDKNIYWL